MYVIENRINCFLDFFSCKFSLAYSDQTTSRMDWVEISNSVRTTCFWNNLYQVWLKDKRLGSQII